MIDGRSDSLTDGRGAKVLRRDHSVRQTKQGTALMASPETDTIQSLEHSLDATDRVTGLCRHLLNAQRDGTAIVPSAVQRYEEQLTELTTQRERMREIVAKWWTLVEDGHWRLTIAARAVSHDGPAPPLWG